MFKVLDRATEGHGYQIIVCWLTGSKAGMFAHQSEIKINDTLMRARSNDLCEKKLGGIWFIASKQDAEELIEEFNAIRLNKGWPQKEFKRINEWLTLQEE